MNAHSLIGRGVFTTAVSNFFTIFLISAVMLIASSPMLSQQCGTGCTEPDACNYDPLAEVNDGTCAFFDCVVVANNDAICIQDGELFSLNVLANDNIPPGLYPMIQVLSDDQCFYLDEGGNILQAVPGADCCGEHTISYILCAEDGLFCDQADVCITVKCGKPDCTLINLDDLLVGAGAGDDPTDSSCISVCENAETTVFVGYNSNNSYIWSIIGGADASGANDAEKVITWGPAGSGNIQLTIGTPNGPEIHNFCVDILPGPTANYTSDTYVCLGQQLCFDNTSVNADAYNWDFGDGEFSSMEDPCHIFNTAGPHTVTLLATKFNFDSQGNPLCCCTDEYSVEIEVDALPGPSIFWVSTLCEGDSSKYWTDATNCDSYFWSVADEDGNSFLFDGQGNDTICVTWPAGAFGTISLLVADCDSSYCSNPTNVVVPIIPTVSQISGPIVVCENATEVYTLPKWLSTEYLWQVTGGTILSGDGSHQATIMWGPAGTGTIHVDYHSSFLAGLPGHENPDCYGSADLSVDILPQFSLMNTGPSLVCVGETSSITATNSPSNLYDWTITPSVVYTGGGDFINIVWPATGTYVITATPTNPGIYCNSTQSVVVQVVELGPATGIDGDLEICPGDTFFYSAITSSTGVNFNWTADNGDLSSPTGPTVSVEWELTGPYTLTLTQQMQTAPFCLSPPISITVIPKVLFDPLVITPGDSCTNILTNFSVGPAQHVDANYEWTIDPSTGGSIASGQGTANVQVQWNNDAIPVTISAQISLCGDTLIKDFDLTLRAPIVPVITQIGIMCPGVEATLDAGPGFTSYSWNTLSTSQTTLTAGEGMYSVTTTDLNNCEATAYYQANDVLGPPAVITSGDPLQICLQAPHNVTLITPYYPGLMFEWYCGGILQGPASPIPYFVHPFANVANSYTYIVKVTDTNTGCIETSLPVTVIEVFCEDGCNSEQYSLFPFAVPQFPACNTVDFSFASSNFTFSNWDFGDTFGSPLPSPSHTYAEAGCYDVIVYGNVPEAGTSNFCGVNEHISICVPLAAAFDCNFLNCTDVQFTDLSTIMVGPGNNIVSWFWDFGVGTSTSPSPIFSFPTTPGMYPVTLTVTNGNGCVSTILKEVTISSVGIPVISGIPTPYCVGVPINFAAASAGAVSYFWTFGDGSSYSGQSPIHTFTSAGPFTVNVAVTSSEGCTASDNINIIVNPGIPEATISGELNICEGFTTNLSAPLGYTYLWSNLSITQTINVGAGTYSVVLTDAFGCARTLDPVTVVELPAPVVSISGNQVICDANCTTLSVPFTPGYTYQWYESLTNPVPGGNGSQLVICSGSILSPYVLEVTDQNNCRGISDPFTITQEVSPSFSVLVSPDDCAGTPSTLTVTPIQPDVVYSWSNGMTGPSIVVSLAGTYTAIGTDMITGCSGSASAVIHPQPDLCSLPVGCYEVCNPDTICGPPGLATYQWNMNGLPIPGAIFPCYEIIESGSYNLTASNNFECFTTSDSLYLEVINCDDPCSDLSIDYSFLINDQQMTDSCCFNLSYVNGYGALQGLTIHTNDADLTVDLGTVDPALQVSSNVGGSISVISDPDTNPIPTGSLPNFIEICIENVVNAPQQIIIDWYDFADDVVCSDTLQFSCPLEPDCLYLQSDSIYCENGLTVYDFTVCNPHDNTFDIGYLTLTPSTPMGVVITPPFFDLTSDPIVPGTCRSLSVTLSGPGIGGQQFCYQLIGHDFDPALVTDALCCSLDTIYCIDIPFCDPCELVAVEAVNASQDGCCYDIVLDNQYDANFFDAIDVCVLSPQTTITVNNPIGSGWTSSGLTTTSVSFIPGTLFGNSVPLGGFSIPEICVQTNVAPNQQIEIKWMRDGEVVCRDTIEVFCEPPCGYLLQESIVCDPSGIWNFSALLKNTSSITMAEAHIFFNDPALSAYDQVVSLGSLAPGAIFSSVNLWIGAPAMPGDTICFTVTLHEMNANGVFLTCCNFEHCIVLPDCDFTASCLCDEQFNANVDAGVTCTLSPNEPNNIVFNLTNFGSFSNCDRVRWSFGDGSFPQETFGFETILHIFPGAGTYLVCAIVYRTDDLGNTCKRKVCKTVVVPVGFTDSELRVFPNPNNGQFQLQINRPMFGAATLTILDETSRPVFASELQGSFEKANIDIDLSSVSKGLYLVRIDFEDKTIVQRIVVY
jgi:PKD repeat protein